MYDQSIYNASEQILNMLMARLGADIFDDTGRFVGALNDLAAGAESKKVKNMLRIAICDLGAFARIKSAYKRGDNFAALNIAREMSEDFLIPLEISSGVIESIAILVGFGHTLKTIAPPPTSNVPHAFSAGQTSAAHVPVSSRPDTQTAGRLTNAVHIPGSLVRYGLYDWRVLDVAGGKALLLSDRVLEKRRYHESLSNITWAESSLRRYLNGEFFNAFTRGEAELISETKLHNQPNPWFGTGGGAMTGDRIFILCIDEVLKYFGDSGTLSDKNRQNKFLVDDRYNNARKSLDAQGVSSWWWVRSPGEDRDFAACVCATGMLSVSGSIVNISGGNGGGVRPAFWLKL